MTQMMYLADSTIFTAEATVLEFKEVEDEMVVVLDQTIFYPQGGGQPHDTGSMIGASEFKVFKVRLQPDGTIYHYGQGQLSEGEVVGLEVDVDRRALHTRLHTAGHLVDIAVKNCGIELVPTKGFHDPAGAYVEYEGELEVSAELIARIEGVVNDLVKKDRAVICELLSPSEAEARGIWAPPGKSARFVYFSGYENLGCGCGGTHTKGTAAIGLITIRKIKSKKGKTRISYAVV